MMSEHGSTTASARGKRTRKRKAAEAPDVRKLQRDPAYFAEHLLRLKLHGYQRAILRDKHQTTVWAGGRGTGKTIVAAVIAAHKAFTDAGHIVVYISARERQAKIAKDTISGLLAGTALADSVVYDAYERIELTNLARVYFLPGSSPVAARGLHNQLAREGEHQAGITLIIDEAAFVPFDTYVASASILNTAPEGKAKKYVFGSARGTNHWFYSEYMAGHDPAQPHTRSFHTNAETVPHISPAQLKELRDKLPPVEYAAEVRAEFQEALNSFFAGYLEGAVRQYRIPALLDADRGMQYALGVDLSTSTRIGSDFTVLVVVGRWPGGWKSSFVFDARGEVESVVEKEVDPFIRIFDIRRFQYLSHDGLRRELEDIHERFPPLRDLYVETYESTQLEAICGVGQGKVPFRLNRFSPTNPLQREAFSHFHALLRDGVLELPSDGPQTKEFFKEMQNFTYEITPAGNFRYGAIEESGAHDDIVYALNWALWGLPKRDYRAQVTFRDGIAAR